MYIKEENGKVIIYEVKINNELKHIRNELIEKFSKITIFEKETTYLNNDTDENEKGKTIVLNYHDTGKVREYNDFYSPDEPIYLVKFKKYEYPKLVIYINEFLNGNFSNLPKLKEFIKPKKIYRINDENRESILELSEHRDYIKRVIDCIKLEVIKENQITSISDLLELIEDLDDKKINEIYNSITQKLDNDSKKLSYLMEEIL